MWQRSVLSCLLALLILLPFGGRPLAQSRKRIDGEVLKICKRAESLLNKLEYERARELLEASVRNMKYRKARARRKALLWALLGRARAELGDIIGMDEAFLKAVRFNRKIRLSRSTSPKILEALERARANAPTVEEPPPEPPPPPPEPPPPPPPEIPPPSQPPPSQPSKPPTPRATPKMRHRIEGELKRGKTVTLIVEHSGFPKRTRFEVKVRRTQSGGFKTVRMRSAAGNAKVKLEIDRPRIEVYVRALKKRRVIKELGSPVDPIVLTTVPRPPPIAEAWSKAPPPGNKAGETVPGTPPLPPPNTPPPESPPASPEKTAASQPPPPKEPTKTPTEEVPGTKTAPPPKAPPSTAPGTKSSTTTLPRTQTATTAPPPTLIQPVDPGLGGLEIGLIAGASVLVVVGVVVGLVLGLRGGSDCDAEEGFGCTEVQILPLLSF